MKQILSYWMPKQNIKIKNISNRTYEFVSITQYDHTSINGVQILESELYHWIIIFILRKLFLKFLQEIYSFYLKLRFF